MYKYVIPILALIPLSSLASESLPAGKISTLTYRSGWVMFKVVNDAGVNLCQSCSVDPGSFGTGKCWVNGDESVQISMILTAQARDKKISGRVDNFSTGCGVYQMTVHD